jgi:hypothetical protein
MLRVLGQNLLAELHASFHTRLVPEHSGEVVRAHEHVKADSWLLVLL